MWAGWLDAKLVELPQEEAANPVTRRRFAAQWSETNPRFRAAHAAARYLEGERIAPLSAGGTLYSDEREILDAERDHWSPRVSVHFGARFLRWAMFDFGQGTPRVLVVLNPTARKQTLRALDMRTMVHRDEFFEFQHGDGRRKLIGGLLLPFARASSPTTCSSSSTPSGRGQSHTLPESASAAAISIPKTCPQIGEGV